MKILGIDPGYGIIGWSVVTGSLKILGYGVIETSRDISMCRRLLTIHDELTRIFEKFHPDQVALEKLFFKNNHTTALDVAKSIGVISIITAKNGLEIDEYTPTQVKHAITGYGRATKEQIQNMIKKIFNIKEIPEPDDAADALAVALCHSLSGGLKKSMESMQYTRQ